MSEDDEVRFRAHSQKQWDLITSDETITLSATGTQWGKSQAGAIWLKRQIHKHADGVSNFLVMAPTYKILQQSALPYFLACMEGMGEYKGSQSLFELSQGGSVFCRTGTDPDSVVGIPKVKAFWLDEAGKASLYFWENIQARAAAVGAKGLLTTTPYSRNWLYKDFIRPFEQGKPPKGVKIIRAPSWENPFHTLHDARRRDEMRGSMDPRRFDMLFGGEWGQMVGLVFDCFDEQVNQTEAFQLPIGTTFVGGVDWGYTEPFVHIVRAITPDGRHYQVSEFYKSGLTPLEQLDLIEQKTKIFGITRHWCGHEQPGLIEELKRRGVSANAADFDIMRGNALHYELIKTRRYKIFQGTSPHTIDEYATYHYPEPEDLDPDDNAKEQKPVGQHDHAMSANRFVTIHEYRSGRSLTPKTPEAQTGGRSPQGSVIHHDPKRPGLKRRPRQGTERWSAP